MTKRTRWAGFGERYTVTEWDARNGLVWVLVRGDGRVLTSYADFAVAVAQAASLNDLADVREQAARG